MIPDCAINGLFNHPGVSFWIHGSGDAERVTIRIRWMNDAMESLAKRFGCEPNRNAVRQAIVAGLEDVFDEVRILHAE
jgi:hypothetical protein